MYSQLLQHVAPTQIHVHADADHVMQVDPRLAFNKGTPP